MPGKKESSAVVGNAFGVAPGPKEAAGDEAVKFLNEDKADYRKELLAVGTRMRDHRRPIHFAHAVRFDSEEDTRRQSNGAGGPCHPTASRPSPATAVGSRRRAMSALSLAP